MTTTRRVHAAAWGAAKLGREVIEECVGLGDGERVLTWLSHG